MSANDKTRTCPENDSNTVDQAAHGVSRRNFFKGVGAAGVAAASTPFAGAAKAQSAPVVDGTPEQIHLTWGEDPSESVVVSWASTAHAVNPRVLCRSSGSHHDEIVHAIQRVYTDGLNGKTVFTYHTHLQGLKAGTAFHYSVTADNSSNAGEPFTATFQTAPRGHAPFRWTSFGDLATPNTTWVMSSPQSRFAVAAVEQ